MNSFNPSVTAIPIFSMYGKILILIKEGIIEKIPMSVAPMSRKTLEAPFRLYLKKSTENKTQTLMG